MAKCNFCGNKKFIVKKVDYLYRNNGRMMLVKNVPCEECSYCGERYFKSNILKTVENTFFSIQNHKKTPGKTIKVPVEEFVA